MLISKHKFTIYIKGLIMTYYDKALKVRNTLWFNLYNKSHKTSYQSILINRLHKLDVLCNQLAFSNIKRIGA